MVQFDGPSYCELVLRWLQQQYAVLVSASLVKLERSPPTAGTARMRDGPAMVLYYCHKAATHPTAATATATATHSLHCHHRRRTAAQSAHRCRSSPGEGTARVPRFADVPLHVRLAGAEASRRVMLWWRRVNCRFFNSVGVLTRAMLPLAVRTRAQLRKSAPAQTAR
jgi:hypothetical protein